MVGSLGRPHPAAGIRERTRHSHLSSPKKTEPHTDRTQSLASALGQLVGRVGFEPVSRRRTWLSGCTALDGQGLVLTDRSIWDELLDNRWSLLGRRPLPFETSHPGLFAIGDIRAGSTKRVATAVGERSAAVRSVHEYLAFTH
jgi:NADPH-dependent glutamate synthase beta subunit-like oxidoreductase